MSSAPEFRPKARRPRGFMDRRGGALARERDIVEKVLGVYQAWGFERLETSAFEYADALGKFLPDQDRPNEGVFALQDDDEQWMALRYDLTAPLARFVAENYDALPKPYRRCAAGPVWRNEKPGPGRFREFWQCDADTVGAASPAADAEMIAMACAALEAAGVARGRYVLKISTRRLLDGILDVIGVNEAQTRLRVLRAIDKADRLGAAGVDLLLGEGRKDESGDFTPGAGLNETQRATVASILGGIGSPHQAGSREAALADFDVKFGRRSDVLLAAIRDLQSIDQTLTSLGVGNDQAAFDFGVVRGLEYYTGAVFEAELLIETTDEDGKPVRFGSVGGGGRYDDLVSRFKGQPIPATGFSIGVSRLAAALAHVDAQADPTDRIVVLPFTQDLVGECFKIASVLRRPGRSVDVYVGDGKLKAQMKYADKRGAEVAVIVAPDEFSRGEVSIKNLALGAAYADLAGSDREKWSQVQSLVQFAAKIDAIEDAIGPALRAAKDAAKGNP